MPHDPARVADTKAWLAKSETDLRVAAHELTATPPFAGDAVFHAQQAAEKAMKGFLAWHDAPFRKTHDLAEIGSFLSYRGTLTSRERFGTSWAIRWRQLHLRRARFISPWRS